MPSSPNPQPITVPRRILLVEGDQHRADFLQGTAEADVDLTRDPDEAIAWLGERIYSDLWLNHDIGAEPKNGRTVSLWLAAHPIVQPWLITRVHSVNPVSAPKIVKELQVAGRPATWVPLPQLVQAWKAARDGH